MLIPKCTQWTEEQLLRVNNFISLTNEYAAALESELPPGPALDESLTALKKIVVSVKKQAEVGWVSITPHLLHKGFAIIEAAGNRVRSIVMTPYAYADFLKNLDRPEDFEKETNFALLSVGIRGYFWGARICVSKTVRPNTLVFIEEGYSTETSEGEIHHPDPSRVMSISPGEGAYTIPHFSRRIP